MHGHRLHGVFATVPGAQVLEDALVYGTGDVEAELRIQAVAHVGKVEVGEEFQQHGGHVGRAALAVGTVPQLAAHPEGLVQRPDVVHHLRLDQVAQQAAAHAVLAVGEPGLSLVGAGIDGQGAHDGIVGRNAGIAVPGQ